MENLQEKLEDCLFRVGIDIEHNEEFDLRESIIDSFFFITVILEIEQEFNIEIPDEYLTIDLFSSIEHLADIISSQKENI